MSTTTTAPGAKAAAAWAAEEPPPAERALVGEGSRPTPSSPPPLPDGLREHLAAVETYTACVRKLAECDARIAQLEAVRSGLQEKAREAQDVMRETDPTRRRRPAGGATGGPSIQELVLAALPGTNVEVAERVGITALQVTGCLTRLRHAGRVERDGMRGSYVWRRADTTRGGSNP